MRAWALAIPVSVLLLAAGAAGGESEEESAPAPPEPAEAAAPEVDPEAEAVRVTPRTGIEEIKITTRKQEESLQKAPVSVRAFSGAELESRGYTQIQDIGRSTANLRFTNVSGTNDEALIYIRGVGQDDFRSLKDPGVGLYIDGVYLPRLQSGLLDLLDVERIEVARGPQGTLFGKNTIGGLVNMITRKPEPGFSSQTQIRVGNRGLIESRAVFNAPLPGPLEDVAFVRAAFASRDVDGFTRNLLSGGRAGNDELRGGRLSLRVLPGESLQLDLSYDVTWQKQSQLLGHCREGNPFTLGRFAVDNFSDFLENCAASELLPRNQAATDAVNKNETWVHGVTGIVSWPGDWHELRYLGSWRSREEQNPRGAELDYTPTPFIGTADGNHSDHWATSHELNWSGRAWDDRLQFVTGLYFFREEGSSRIQGRVLQQFVIPELQAMLPPTQTVGGFPIPYAAVDAAVASAAFDDRVEELVGEGLSQAEAEAQAGAEQASRECCLGITGSTASLNNVDFDSFENDSYAAYGQLTLDLFPDVHLTGGLRFTYEEKRRGGRIERLFPEVSSPAPEAFPQRQDFSQLTPTVQAAWDVSDDFMAYGRYARGWKSGGFNETILTSEDLERGTFLEFDPETADSFEAGLKTSWLDRRLVLNLTGFVTLYEDIQVTTLSLNETGTVSAFIENAGKALIHGFELEGTALVDEEWLPGPGAHLVLTGGVGYTQADFQEFLRDEFIQEPVPPGCTSLRLSDCGTTLLNLLNGTAPIFDILEDLTNPTLTRVDRSDLDFKNTPEWTINASAIYGLDLGSSEQLMLRAVYYYQSKVFHNTDNTIHADPYSLVDARVALTSQRFLGEGVTLALFVRNAFDERFVAGGLPLGETVGADGLFFNEPRTWGMEAFVRF